MGRAAMIMRDYQAYGRRLGKDKEQLVQEVNGDATVTGRRKLNKKAC